MASGKYHVLRDEAKPIEETEGNKRASIKKAANAENKSPMMPVIGSGHSINTNIVLPKNITNNFNNLIQPSPRIADSYSSVNSNNSKIAPKSATYSHNRDNLNTDDTVNSAIFEFQGSKNNKIQPSIKKSLSSNPPGKATVTNDESPARKKSLSFEFFLFSFFAKKKIRKPCFYQTFDKLCVC